MPAVPPPSPQEIQRKLSVHSVTRAKSSNQSAGPVSGTESDEDALNMSDVLQPMAHIGSGLHTGAPSSLPPLSSIAERRSGSGEDSDDEDVIEGGWKTADIRTKPRNSVDESVIKSGYLWKKGERRKTWKKRWFVLRPAHLAYYKSSAEYQLLRLLELSDVHSCTQVNLKRHDNTFGLISPVRTFYLRASSPAEVQQWVSAIEEARLTLLATSTQTSVSTPIPIPKSQEQPHPRGSFPASVSPPYPPYAHAITSSDSEDATSNIQRGAIASSPTRTTFAMSPSKSATVLQKDAAKVILSGYLMKCGSKRRNWRKRWFVLTEERLIYSGSHMDTKPHRLFPFGEILDALEYDLPSHRQNPAIIAPAISSPPTQLALPDIDEAHGSHTFKIVTTKRTLLLCAPSEEDEIKWLGAIRALIARRSGSGVVPGSTSKSVPLVHSSDAGPPLASGANVGIKPKHRRLSAGGSIGLGGVSITEEGAQVKS